jgi:peptide/nickel transport system permease protein
MPKFILLWTDAALFLMLIAVVLYAWHVRRTPTLRHTWTRVLVDAPAMCAAVVLLVFAVVGILDSVHYRPRLPPAEGVAAAAPAYAPTVQSLLDRLLRHTVLTSPEKTYSAPLATRQFTKETVLTQGQPLREFPRLKFGGAHLADPDAGILPDILQRLGGGLLSGAAAAALVFLAISAGLRRHRPTWGEACADLLRNRTHLPWRAVWITTLVLCLVAGALAGLSTGYHAFGTNSTGNDVLWQSLKSIRTALVIGSLTTVAMLPPAILLGISAGYFKGRIDDIIQYVYTTLTSIPGVLLVAACVLMMQAYIDNNAALYDTSAARADLRLFLLCMILGLTGWAGLCRLLRAETLKLRELEYVQAARAFGVSDVRIMRRHILPNVMHIVLITVVLEFSGLVLYEAVLSYLGIGVDPTMNSFGSMIDASRLEMSRDPMIWWSLSSAFVFMLTLVLAANLFADAVRDAFDPRTRRFRPARKPLLLPAQAVSAAPPSEGRQP